MEFKTAFRDYVWSRPSFARLLAMCMMTLFGGVIRAEDPLHLRIDAQLAEIHPGPESPLCSDGEFMRRAFLDLAGVIPSGEQARAFIEDTSPDKRAKLIDRLLGDPGYAKQMAQIFDVMLMERRANKYVQADQWSSYLLTSFRQNKPLNELAGEILAADGVDEKQRGPAKFYLEREVEPNLITREVGRVFFGMDLQCAQCHDHPNIDDYYQSDYYGLFAFVNRSYLFQPDKKKPAVLAEKAEGDAKFKSVFTEEEGQTLPRLPGGVEIDEPTFAKDQAYQVKPDPKQKNVRPIPKHSRRAALARRATDGSNRAFNRNLANRLWAHMMGRGLVHPVDQHHSDNPPAHPRLLEILADELASTSFDIKSILRQLALSRTYQRTIDLPTDFASHAKLASEQIDSWREKSIARASAVRRSQMIVGELEQRRQRAQQQLAEIAEAEQQANESLAEADKHAAAAKQALAAAAKPLAEQQQLADLLAAAVSQAAEAAKRLESDQELGAALSVLRNRSQAARARVDELTGGLAKLTAANQAASQTLSAAQARSDQAFRQRLSTELTLAAMEASLAKAEQQLLFDRTTVSHAKRQVARFKAALAYGQADQRRRTLQSEAQDLAGQLADSGQSIAQLEQEVNRLNSELTAGESAGGEAAAGAIARANNELASARKRAEATRQQQAVVAERLAEQIEQSQARRDELTAAWSEQFSIAVVQPLSPEQLARSILKITGYDRRQREIVKASLDKKSPLKPDERNDAAKLAAREQQIDAETEKKLSGIVDRFVRLFGAAAGQPQDDFFATVDQALFFGNGGELRSWLAPANGNLTDRLQQIEDPQTLAEELYLSVLTRLPSEREIADVSEYLAADGKPKRDGVQELAWALLTSAEFRFQH